MKILILLMLLVAGHAQAVMQYRPPEPVPSQEKSINVVPIVSVVAAIVATGYVIFRARKAKKQASRFNVYVNSNVADRGTL